jgi:hypothetical protein
MKEKNDSKINNTDGYPIYPESEDIYSKFKKIKEVKPDEIALIKDTYFNLRASNELIIEEDFIGSNLDLAEEELNFKKETIELEKEEINYFSLDNEDTDEELGQI